MPSSCHKAQQLCMKNAKCNLFITSSLLFSCLFALHFATRIMYMSYIIGPSEPGAEGGRCHPDSRSHGSKTFYLKLPSIFVFVHPPPHILDFPTPLFMIKFRFVRVLSVEGMISIVSISKKEAEKS